MRRRLEVGGAGAGRVEGVRGFEGTGLDSRYGGGKTGDRVARQGHQDSPPSSGPAQAKSKEWQVIGSESVRRF